MRHKKREIQDKALIEEIMAKAEVCRLGLCKDNMPYIVPVSFGYDGSYIYFHTAGEGMKIDYIASNNQICFELEHDVRVIPDDDAACKWSMSFYSVIGFGTVEEIADRHLKIHALAQIMKHYSNREWDFDEQVIEKTRLWRISIDRLTGKQSKDRLGS
jgi:nitroimidazol reductase NimA-like FMN-containing flavoprotein (pyridoxamine 5'-phosphate oxidase superfamily)